MSFKKLLDIISSLIYIDNTNKRKGTKMEKKQNKHNYKKIVTGVLMLAVVLADLSAAYILATNNNVIMIAIAAVLLLHGVIVAGDRFVK